MFLSLLLPALVAVLSVSSRPLARSPFSHSHHACNPSSSSASPSSPATSSLPVTTPVTTSSLPVTTPSPSPTSPATSSPSSSVPVPTSTAITTVSDTSSSSSNGPFYGGVATYFYQDGNAGACGQVHSDSDYICAMDQQRFGTSGSDSSLCGKQVQITNQSTGQSITVTVADDCPTCENENSIDLSVGAFSALADLSEGTFDIVWSYVS